MIKNALLPADKLRAAAEATEPVSFRQVPHNIEAEQALLGAILVNNESLDRVSSFLLAEHFYDPLHAEIFSIASKLIGAGKQATPVTLRTFFENAEPIDDRLTVPQYLGRLATSATTSFDQDSDGNYLTIGANNQVPSNDRRDFANDRNTRPQRFYRIINEVPTLLMIVIVVLVVVKPF